MQGGQPGSNQDLNGSLKLGPTGEVTHARTHAHTLCGVYETKRRPCSSLYFTHFYFFFFFFLLLPFSHQMAAAFEVLQKTIAGAPLHFCDFNSSLASMKLQSLLFPSLFHSVYFLSVQSILPWNSKCISIRWLSESLIHISTQLN